MKKLLLAIALVVSMSAYGSAAVIDLTTANSGTINGAQFIFGQEQPAGSGVLDSFLRIHAKGNAETEQGYNSDLPNNQLPFDEVGGGFTHHLLISTLTNNEGYYHFLLDINESNGRGESLLSLDGLKLYTSTVPSPTPATLFAITPFYDMDAGGVDNYVLLDADREKPGSGLTDMLLRIPVSLLVPEEGKDYLILWSQFGLQEGASGGFEEWAARTTEENQPIPEPGTVLLLGAGLAGLALYSRRQSNK